ncbi:MAG: glycoside hydrolase family 28 protein [Candidatus Moraniibacteriota bacterium]|nr:MAG: glycoside hydrolase family 28 protein [Candidatus Moranbacteria bacterium]
MPRGNFRMPLILILLGGLVISVLFGVWTLYGEQLRELSSSSTVFTKKISPENTDSVEAPEIPREFPDISKLIPPPTSVATLKTLSGASFTLEEVGFPEHTCSIVDYGAISDGVTSNTEAFRKTIDDCARTGGGTVIVPPGTWFTGPIHLASNINLHLEKGSTILFSTNFEEYLPAVFSRFEGIEYYNYSAPIYTANAFNVAITGEGTLDGQGAAWWAAMRNWDKPIKRLYQMGDDGTPVSERVFGTVKDSLRPAFIEFMNCDRVLVEGVSIQNGPMWTIHPLYSKNIIVRGVHIETSEGQSTDGVALDSSQNVLIENSVFSTGDDAIVLKSGRNRDGLRVRMPAEHVLIRNNSILEAHAAVAIGSEMSGDVRNVFIENLSANMVQYGFRIKSSKGRGGIVENIYADGIKIDYASIAAIQLTTSYENSFIKGVGAIPLFRNIHVENMTVGKTDRSIEISGLIEQPITDITFKNIKIFAKWGSQIEEANSLTFDTISAVPTKGSVFDIANSSAITFKNTRCPLARKDCLVISGPSSKDIDIHESTFTQDSVTFSKDANPDALVTEK